MRVLHVFKDYFPPTYGGVEQHIAAVATATAHELEVEVLTASRSRRGWVEDCESVRVVRSPEYGRMASTPITPGWWPILRGAAPGVVHVHLPNPMAALTLVTASRRPPLVVSYHADVQRRSRLAPAYLELQDQLLSRADRIVVGSPALVESSPALVSHRDRAVVVPYGVDATEWPADRAAVAAIRAAHSSAPLLLFVGRLVRYKGLGVLLEAMRSVDGHLLVVGEGPMRASLEAAAEAAGVASRVHFTGSVTNTERSAYYAAADVFVLPATSRAESFGIAMLEAMAAGVPAISTEVGTGTSWVNRSGVTGLVVPPGDPAALAEAASALLGDDELRKEYAHAAARRASEHFSKRDMLDRLLSLYRAYDGDNTSR